MADSCSSSKDMPKLVVILEKKGRGRGMSIIKTWAVRTFKLDGQNLVYYDKEKLKGTVNIEGSTCAAVEPSKADNKEFPFVVDTGKEKLILNASTEEMRTKCINILNFAASSMNWIKLDEKNAEEVKTLESNTGVHEVRSSCCSLPLFYVLTR